MPSSQVFWCGPPSSRSARCKSIRSASPAYARAPPTDVNSTTAMNSLGSSIERAIQWPTAPWLIRAARARRRPPSSSSKSPPRKRITKSTCPPDRAPCSTPVGRWLEDPDHLEPGRLGLGVLLDPHAQPPHDADRGGILALGRGDDAGEVELGERVVDERRGRLGGDAAAAVRRRDGPVEADLGHEPAPALGPGRQQAERAERRDEPDQPHQTAGVVAARSPRSP